MCSKVQQFVALQLLLRWRPCPGTRSLFCKTRREVRVFTRGGGFQGGARFFSTDRRIIPTPFRDPGSGADSGVIAHGFPVLKFRSVRRLLYEKHGAAASRPRSSRTRTRRASRNNPQTKGIETDAKGHAKRSRPTGATRKKSTGPRANKARKWSAIMPSNMGCWRTT
jgi:hypothetical protein